MSRLHFGFVFLALYVVWLGYRALVKKDIKKYKNEFYLYTFFIVIWGLIYCWFFAEEIGRFINKQ